MKILFLDIDGVLNREGTRELCGPSSDMLPEQHPRFVHTNYIHGVTLADMEKMVALFET